MIKGITPQKLHVVFCPNIQRSSDPFMCLDLKMTDVHGSVPILRDEDSQVTVTPKTLSSAQQIIYIHQINGHQ